MAFRLGPSESGDSAALFWFGSTEPKANWNENCDEAQDSAESQISGICPLSTFSLLFANWQTVKAQLPIGATGDTWEAP